MAEKFEHIGTVESFQNGLLKVRVQQLSACSGCHAKDLCTSAEKKDRILEIDNVTGSFTTKDTVLVQAQSSMGMKAVLIAFVIPLILLVGAYFISFSIKHDEGFGALISLIVLIVYFTILSRFKKQLKNQFIFTIKKLN